MTSEKRIAIVGAGISGLSAAWALHRAGFDVTVFEKGDTLGGHARTVQVDDAGERRLVEAGVQVMCPTIYPHIVAIARLVGVRLIPFANGYTSLTRAGEVVGVHHHDTDFWRRVEPECVRFTVEMGDLVALNSVEVLSWSILEYLHSHGYSDTFIELMESFTTRLLGWQEDSSSLETSVVVVASALVSGFISFVSHSSHEMAFEGGVSALVEAFAAPIRDRVHLGRGVEAIRRSPSEVSLRDERGVEERFAQVILCVDGLFALELLEDPSPLEENLLASAQIQRQVAVLHRDSDLLIPGIADASRTYVEVRDGFMTVNKGSLNLEKRPLAEPLFITYTGPTDTASDGPVDPAKTIACFDWRHTRDNVYSFEVKRNLFRIQGVQRTWYAGAWTTMSTFEHAAVSGLVIAEAIGAPYPFPHEPRAARSYPIFRDLMLRGIENFHLGML